MTETKLCCPLTTRSAGTPSRSTTANWPRPGFPSVTQSRGRALGSNAGIGPRTFMLPLGETLVPGETSVPGWAHEIIPAANGVRPIARKRVRSRDNRDAIGALILFGTGGEKDVPGLQPFPRTVGKHAFRKTGMIARLGFSAL